MRLGLDDFLPNDVGSADAPDGGPVLTAPHSIMLCLQRQRLWRRQRHCERGYGSSVVNGRVAACPYRVFVVGPDEGHRAPAGQ